MTIYIALPKARSLCGQTLCVHRVERPTDAVFSAAISFQKSGKKLFSYRVKLYYCCCCNVTLHFYFRDLFEVL